LEELRISTVMQVEVRESPELVIQAMDFTARVFITDWLHAGRMA